MSEFDFDGILDDVLEKDTLVEPRPGMEQRVLARVREERTAVVRMRGWWFGAAASLAACLVIAVAVHHWSGTRDISPVPGAQAVVEPPSAMASSTHAVVSPPEAKRAPLHREAVRRSSSVRAVPADGVKQVREERLPKMDTFPAVTQRDVSTLARSPEAIEALQNLKAEQERPVQISAIVIQPL
jgi:hypothetical protein